MLLPFVAALVLAAAPPPVFAIAGGKEIRLGQGSYCWRGTCADYRAPRCGDGRTPNVRVRKGDVLRFRLAFRASDVSLVFLPPRASRAIPLTVKSPHWTATRGGVFLLFARSPEGWDTALAGCLRLAPS